MSMNLFFSSFVHISLVKHFEVSCDVCAQRKRRFALMIVQYFFFNVYISFVVVFFVLNAERSTRGHVFDDADQKMKNLNGQRARH